MVGGTARADRAASEVGSDVTVTADDPEAAEIKVVRSL